MRRWSAPFAGVIGLLACLAPAHADPTQPWTTGSYYTLWANQQPLRVRPFAYNSGASATQNGSDLADAAIVVDLLGRALGPLSPGVGSRVIVLTSGGAVPVQRSVHLR